ncbi:MAG: hypothetical protein LBK66_07670 [Spirochaetaceae bacterium]|jgi:hypothetical protein|nr:hypothetical protein [Spirochaetaceae bacterium]
MENTKKKVMVFGLFLLAALGCFSNENNQFTMAGTAWRNDYGLSRSAYNFVNETEFAFCLRERVVYNGTYRVDGQKVLLFPEDGYIINELGRQAWLEITNENETAVDDRGNVYKLDRIPVNNNELVPYEQKDIIPSGQEAHNELIAGKAWASHTDDTPQRIIYWFVDEKEMVMCRGAFENIIGRSSYTYVNGAVFLKQKIFRKEFSVEIKIENDKMYRENGDIYTRIL